MHLDYYYNFRHIQVFQKHKIKPEQLQQEAIQSTLKKIKERNQEFEKSYITPKSALKNALNTTSMEKVEEARAQEMTQENAREEEKENG